MANHPQTDVKRIERDAEFYVSTRSLTRSDKERAMRQRVLKGLRKDLAKLSQEFARGRIRRKELIYTIVQRRYEHVTITILRLAKKLRDKGFFFQELADRGVDFVATEIIQPHVLHHFAAVITGGADRERADDSLLHSVAAI